MNDQEIRQVLAAVTEDVDRPTDEFVTQLRQRLDIELRQASQIDDVIDGDDLTDRQKGIMALDLGTPISEKTEGPRWTNRRLVMVGVAAAVVVIIGLVAVIRSGDDERTVSVADDPTTSIPDDSATGDDAAPAPRPLPSEPLAVGELWLQSILDGDRETFVALHDPEFSADDTLIGGSSILPSDEIPGVYFDGYDANAAYWATGDYPVESDGCEQKPNGRISCGFTELLLGDPDKISETQADLTIVDGRITDVRFDIRTEPQLFARFPVFLQTEATELDVECALMGFNSVACGEHHADLLRRYFEYRDPQSG